MPSEGLAVRIGTQNMGTRSGEAESPPEAGTLPPEGVAAEGGGFQAGARSGEWGRRWGVSLPASATLTSLGVRPLALVLVCCGPFCGRLTSPIWMQGTWRWVDSRTLGLGPPTPWARCPALVGVGSLGEVENQASSFLFPALMAAFRCHNGV